MARVFPEIKSHQTDPLYGVCTEKWDRIRSAMRLKLSGPQSFESVCERLLGADERVSEGQSLMRELNRVNMEEDEFMRGLFANEPFEAYEIVAGLRTTDSTDVAENDTRLWNRAGDSFYTYNDEKSSGWLVNSNQGSVVVGKNGKEFDQFYETNCAFAEVSYYSLVRDRRTWQSVVVVVTTKHVGRGDEFVTHYPLPLRPPFLWADRFDCPVIY